MAALLGGISNAKAEEWLNFYPIEGELRLLVDSRWQDNDGGESSREMKAEEGLRLRLAGYSLDPRIFTFNLSMEPVLTQSSTQFPGVDQTSDGSFLNYGGGFSLLHGAPISPVSLTANIARNSGELDGNLGSRTEFTTEDRRADLHWKTRIFPSTFSYSERSLDETFRSGFDTPSVDRDESLRTLRYHGRSSKMELLLEGNSFDDRTSFDRDYTSELARVSNFFRWGKGSSLTSRAEHFEREEFNASERVSVDESVRLQHTKNLFTTYAYRFQSLARETDTDTHSGNFGLTHQLFRNLTTNLTLGGSTTQSDQFREDAYNADLDFAYTRKIRRNGRFSANLGSGYRVTDRDGGRIDFTEAATVPASGIVVLAQRFIDQSTIIVTATACGGAPCLEGIGNDYLVEDAGGDFTQLRIPLGNRINVGDTITAEYVYQPPTAKYDGIPYRAGARLDFGWIALFHRSDGENQSLISGADENAVNDRRNDATGVELRWSRPGTRATIGAERRFSESDDYKSTEYAFRQSLYRKLAPNASLNLTASESFLFDGTDADTYMADMSVNWFPAPGFSVRPHARAFWRTVEPGTGDTFIGVGVDMRRNWRQLATVLRYNHNHHGGTNAGTDEDRIILTVSRKF